MKIPLKWLNKYVKLPNKTSILTEALTLAGHMLDKTEKVNGDDVVDLELRGNRADCYCLIGIAREVSALFDTPVKLPESYKSLLKNSNLKEVSLQINSSFVNRAMMVVIKNVQIKQSPDWLKKPIQAYGIDSINNIVDLTNFVMLETGQPMHAFDLDKIGNHLEIRKAVENEKVTTFLGKTVTLNKEDLVWANKREILSIAGSVGEKYHSISESTKNVLLEAASYDRANIRRTIYRHNLLTDAGLRHEKELDPNIVEKGVYRFLYLVDKHNWGQINPRVFDYYPKPVKPWTVNLNYDYLETLGGLKLDTNKVKNILNRLSFKIKKESNNGLEVICPTFRTDVTLEEDLIEEILRIQGYDNIPTRTLSLEIPSYVTPEYISQEQELKLAATEVGLDEIITSSFVNEKYQEFNKNMEHPNASPVKIVNRPSQDTEILRTTLLANLLEVTQKVINERGTAAQFFEIGKIYFKQKTHYEEKRKLGLISWSKDSEVFAKFKGLLESLLTKTNIENLTFDNQQINNPKLINTYSISLEKTIFGLGGEFGNIFYCEIDLDLLLGKAQNPTAQLWPNFPPQIEDITLSVRTNTKVGDVLSLIKNTKYVADVQLIDTYEGYYTFRIWYQHPSKTLTDKEVEKSRKSLLHLIKQRFRAIIKE